jgi:hypothetical protein
VVVRVHLSSREGNLETGNTEVTEIEKVISQEKGK